MRLFAAINLPKNVTDGLRREQAKLAKFGDRLRLVDASGLHMTLCFVGELQAQEVEVIEHGIRGALTGESPFMLALGEGGSFPKPDNARVVWVGVDGELRRLENVQNLIADEIRSLGYRIDRRPFSPHVTLARVSRSASSDDRRSIAESTVELTGYRMGSFEVRSVDLMESIISREGATYSTVAHISLISPD